MHCGDKRAFLTKKDAQTAINAATRGRKARRHGRRIELSIYPCPRCKSWHLTKQTE